MWPHPCNALTLDLKCLYNVSNVMMSFVPLKHQHPAEVSYSWLYPSCSLEVKLFIDYNVEDKMWEVLNFANNCALVLGFQKLHQFKTIHWYRVTMLITEHLVALRRLNPHTLGIWFSGSKNNCSSPPSASKLAKIAQFNKRMKKIWGVWCKGV
jgi:hypothetical protein